MNPHADVRPHPSQRLASRPAKQKSRKRAGCYRQPQSKSIACGAPPATTCHPERSEGSAFVFVLSGAPPLRAYKGGSSLADRNSKIKHERFLGGGAGNVGFSSGHGFIRAAAARKSMRLQPLRDDLASCHTGSFNSAITGGAQRLLSRRISREPFSEAASARTSQQQSAFAFFAVTFYACRFETGNPRTEWPIVKISAASTSLQWRLPAAPSSY